ICHLSFVICHLSFVICHLSLVIGHWSLVIGHWSLVSLSLHCRSEEPSLFSAASCTGVLSSLPRPGSVHVRPPAASLRLRASPPVPDSQAAGTKRPPESGGRAVV